MQNNNETPVFVNLKYFIFKSLIVSCALFFTVSALLPEVPKIPETERNKLILLSFIQNPNILMKLAIIEEGRGKRQNAIIYLEAAVGLLEMNGASEKTINKYQYQIDSLKNKLGH
jgi:hypothetical protein